MYKDEMENAIAYFKAYADAYLESCKKYGPGDEWNRGRIMAAQDLVNEFNDRFSLDNVAVEPHSEIQEIGSEKPRKS